MTAPTEEVYDSVIVGSGPAGLTAAIYNVRAAMKTVVVEGDQPGGQLTITTVVENFPGFASLVGGIKLMTEMRNQAVGLGAKLENGRVEKIEKREKYFEVRLKDGRIILGKTVIIATGAAARWLDLPKEKDLMGRGVSGCATCDGTFFKGKEVAIVGGGNTACDEAVFLAKMVKKVYLIHRRDQFRAGPIEQKRVFDSPNIEIWWNSEVREILGDEKVVGIVVENNKTGEKKELRVEGLFVAIGRIPATNFVKGLVELYEEGQIVTGKNQEFPTMTSMEGIFATGDCADAKYRQAIVAAGDGAKAAIDSQRWLGSR